MAGRRDRDLRPAPTRPPPVASRLLARLGCLRERLGTITRVSSASQRSSAAAGGAASAASASTTQSSRRSKVSYDQTVTTCLPRDPGAGLSWISPGWGRKSTPGTHRRQKPRSETWVFSPLGEDFLGREAPGLRPGALGLLGGEDSNSPQPPPDPCHLMPPNTSELPKCLATFPIIPRRTSMFRPVRDHFVTTRRRPTTDRLGEVASPDALDCRPWFLRPPLRCGAVSARARACLPTRRSRRERPGPVSRSSPPPSLCSTSTGRPTAPRRGPQRLPGQGTPSPSCDESWSASPPHADDTHTISYAVALTDRSAGLARTAGLAAPDGGAFLRRCRGGRGGR